MVKPENVTAIVLCGGLGTRLHSVTNDKIPKPMVSIAGRPFLEYLLDYLLDQGITKAILAVSHHSDVIIQHFGHRYRELSIYYSIEQNPLGTGGAIKQTLIENSGNEPELYLILNGDTYFEYDLNTMIHTFYHKKADIIMALKPMDDTGRYGRVTIDRNQKIIAFEEKKQGDAGKINAGVYLISNKIISLFPDLNSFSFEKDFFEKQLGLSALLSYAVTKYSYFIDIGIPEDYYQANNYFIK